MVTRALASTFDILPAIDLRDGRVVRLEQGDFARETAFSDDPVAVARGFADAGARWLHVVDLDGARTGEPAHGPVIRAIVEAIGERLAVEVAGGLRSADAVAATLAAGATRAVVGTAALRDPGFAGRLVAEHGADAVAVALDVRDGQAVGQGWIPGAAGVPVGGALETLADAGVRTFEVTAIDRDGTGGGPDMALYRRVVALGRGAIVASAGIASTGDIAAVRSLGCTGAIVGRALYDGRLTVADALATATSGEPIVIRRTDDDEVLGAVQPVEDGSWRALTVFGGTLGIAPSAAGARAIVEADGMGSMARRWFVWRRADPRWSVALIQEAWPGRVRLVLGAYALPGVPTVELTAADLAAGDVLTLTPPPDADLDQLSD